MWKRMKNQFTLIAFCGIIGAVAGGVIWTFLKLVAVGTDFLWKWLPEQCPLPYYTVLACTAGAALIGVFRWKFGNYPEDLETVMGKVKAEKRYDYSNIIVLLISAMLPILLGSSIGPEAGLTGVIVGLCYWVGDNLSFARQNAKEYSQVGGCGRNGMLYDPVKAFWGGW